MNVTSFYVTVIEPAAVALSTVKASLDTPQARCMMLAIAGQESAWTDRVQVPGGAARGFWQFELPTVGDVIADGYLVGTLDDVCGAFSIPMDQWTIFEAIAYHDTLAYTVARLLLWADPPALPAVGDEDGAWATYLRVWRPGAPSRDRWGTVYPQALGVITA